MQRTDVDNFYGSIFEGDFVDIQYGSQSPEQVIVNPDLSKRLRPEFLGGEVVKHFVARGPVPDHFTEAVVGGPCGAIRVGLGITPRPCVVCNDEGMPDPI